MTAQISIASLRPVFDLTVDTFGGALTFLSGDQSTKLAAALTGAELNYLYSIVFVMYGLSRECRPFQDSVSS
jgi:hypothetical protein